MSRYFIQPAKQRRAFDDEWWPEPFINIPTVCKHEAIDTGLLDKDGNCIMKAPNPIGFGKDEDW